MSTEKPKFPPVSGKIVFEGLASTNFWIRVFGLEKEIEFVQTRISEKKERKTAAVPIISEYEVDKDKLKFFYVLNLKIDALGVQDGLGMVFFTDKENTGRTVEARDRLANQILQSLEGLTFDEEIEFHSIGKGRDT